VLREEADGSMYFSYMNALHTHEQYSIPGSANASQRSDFADIVFSVLHPHVEVVFIMWSGQASPESTATVDQLEEDNRVTVAVRLAEGQVTPPATAAYKIEHIDRHPTRMEARADLYRALNPEVQASQSIAPNPQVPTESGKAEDHEVAGIRAAAAAAAADAETSSISEDWLRRLRPRRTSRSADDSSSSSYPSFGSGVVRPTAREGTCYNLMCKYCSKPLNTEYCRKWHVKCRQEALELAADGKYFNYITILFLINQESLLISFEFCLYILDCESLKYIPSREDYTSDDAVYTAEADTAKSSSRDAGGTPITKIL
jgi:hypothetical protein